MEHHHTTEHFSPARTDQIEIAVNIDRYLFALQFLAGKTVLDLGCGAGIGTYLYSLVAEKVYAVDHDQNAIEEARMFPFPHKNVEFINADIEDPDAVENLPAVDVCVALEVLEHIEDPAGVLRDLKAKQLVFSMPLHSMEVSTWHKYRIDTERDVRALIGPFYDIHRYEEQRHRLIGGVWIRGEGVRILQ